MGHSPSEIYVGNALRSFADGNRSAVLSEAALKVGELVDSGFVLADGL